MSQRNLVSAGLLVVALSCVAPRARADFTPIGPTPYLSFADSPFKSTSFGYFYLETFEDGSLNVPGVTAISNTPGTSLAVGLPGFNTDSVDGDDGVIDGLGRDGHSFAEGNNKSTDDLGYTFRFDASVLGALPTHVGIVWTDGDASAATQLEVYGPANDLLGIIGPFHISDGTFSGTTGEDRFFGAINDAGISQIVIRSPGGVNNMEVDHLQYGLRAVPEPASALMLGTGAVALLGYARRRRGASRTSP